ncbi:MAG TPA: T9SS type A sorting domain-containing protein [Candidatus Cloacimonadota bacterium]|mgnify:CR=1 FL=1|nr:T9SS type A sorting domain-containing protein [Candidatus Cloacimonadota bacterium]
MKVSSIFIIALMIVLSTTLHAISGKSSNNERTFDSSVYNQVGNMQLRVSNYGCLGSDTNTESSWPSLEYPANSGIDYLNIGALWIGAKKHRRNSDGQVLYWLAQEPHATPADSAMTITQDDPLWTPLKSLVMDTLVTVGYDGDENLYELLPAYNILEGNHENMSQLYSTYNAQDTVFQSFLHLTSPRPFELPDPTESYCFSVVSPIPEITPGIETLTSYYYDYSPFGTTGDRDLGIDHLSSIHYPLHIAVKQQSYTWPYSNYRDLIVIKYTIINTSPVDTLFDLNTGIYMDCDCGPQSWSPSYRAADDVSGYISGQNYEFAYSRDHDGDAGLTNALIGTKLVIPNYQDILLHTCWYWKLGDGPDDNDAMQLPYSFSPHKTPNEKYWLMMNHNPNANKYVSLRQDDNQSYEQPTACDTRYLNSVFTSPMGFHPDSNSLYLPPNGSFDVYMAIFKGYDFEDLKASSMFATDFINSNFDMDYDPNEPTMPFAVNMHQTDAGLVSFHWLSCTTPSHFDLMYKLADAPASTWQSVSVDGILREGTISNLQDLTEYDFKLASIFNVNNNEVYLESPVQTLYIDNASSNHDQGTVTYTNSILTYPNPFHKQLLIEITNKELKPSLVEIFNIRGQKIKELIENDPNANIVWDGTDTNGHAVGNGIYLIRAKSGNTTSFQKVLLLK